VCNENIGDVLEIVTYERKSEWDEACIMALTTGDRSQNSEVRRANKESKQRNKDLLNLSPLFRFF